MDRAQLLVGGFTLTEAPRWHDHRLWFSDLYDERVYSVREDGSDLRVELQPDGVPVGLGWLPDGRLVVVVQDKKLIVRREHDGSLAVHADLSEHCVGLPNDLAMTPSGTAFVGCFGFDLYAAEPVAPAPLMRITADGEVSSVGEPLWFANGPTVIDGRTIVFAETFANRLSAFDLLDGDVLSDRRDWATVGPLPTSTDMKERSGELVVACDGISVPDAEGAIWVGDFTKPWVNRVLPTGEIAQQVSTGDLNCFAAALGGSDGRTMFLCAAPSELDPVIRKNEPESAILSYRVDVPAAG
jgi:sugar lactone lactonase YvrE